MQSVDGPQAVLEEASTWQKPLRASGALTLGLDENCLIRAFPQVFTVFPDLVLSLERMPNHTCWTPFQDLLSADLVRVADLCQVARKQDPCQQHPVQSWFRQRCSSQVHSQDCLTTTLQSSNHFIPVPSGHVLVDTAVESSSCHPLHGTDTIVDAFDFCMWEDRVGHFSQQRWFGIFELLKFLTGCPLQCCFNHEVKGCNGDSKFIVVQLMERNGTASQKRLMSLHNLAVILELCFAITEDVRSYCGKTCRVNNHQSFCKTCRTAKLQGTLTNQ
mmetsp:Transcript_40676/g.73287  ORF Transcript_40676/g.73287 Transcript_40676/m.73287 type:complete len:274 (-) Transcript_40676:644-1465(-)